MSCIVCDGIGGLCEHCPAPNSGWQREDGHTAYFRLLPGLRLEVFFQEHDYHFNPEEPEEVTDTRREYIVPWQWVVTTRTNEEDLGAFGDIVAKSEKPGSIQDQQRAAEDAALRWLTRNLLALMPVIAVRR